MYMSGGGAILARTDCDSTLTGRTAFSNNTAGHLGGAVHILGGRVTVDRPMCAQGNKAAAGGGFAYVELPEATEQPTKGAVNFTARSAGTRLGADAAPNIVVFSLMSTWGQGKVVCAGGSKAWPPRRYSVMGDPCACSADFVRGASRTCDSCEGGWDPHACDCKVGWAATGCLVVVPERRCGHLIGLSLANWAQNFSLKLLTKWCCGPTSGMCPAWLMHCLPPAAGRQPARAPPSLVLSVQKE